MGNWTSDITNDPHRDYKLCVEIQEDGHHRARLFQDDDGVMLLRVFAGEEATIPVGWLLGIVGHFQADLATTHDRDE